MPLDGIALRCAVLELSGLESASVQKIYQPEKDEIVLLLHTKDGNKRLIISASPASPRIHVTVAEYKNPETAPMFCMLLRKHFTGAKLLKISQYGLDRVVDLTFDCHNEMGDTVRKHIIIEIMSRNSNIIITDAEYKIFECLRKNDITSDYSRTMLPGFCYSFPDSDGKTDITKASEEDIRKQAARIEENDDRLQKYFTGFSPLAGREATEYGDVAEYVLKVKEAIEKQNFSPCVIFDGDKPIDFWCFVPREYENALEIQKCSSVSEAMEAYYRKKDTTEHMKQKTASLTKLVTNLLSRAERKLKLQLKELSDAGQKDNYKQMGDLIKSNIYKIQKGMKIAEVSDWTTGEEKLLRIPIDENLSPSDNAQRYYKKYSKAKNAEIMIKEQIRINNAETEYLSSVLQSIEVSDNMDDIAQIKQELTEGGYIKPEGGKKKKEVKAGPIETEFEGFKIFIGKNNKQNDILTLKTARANDIWLHVKNSAGSHVIIVSGGQEVPSSVIEYAAHLAATHSKANGAPKTEVDYTRVKNVKKPVGAKPGMVIYVDYKTCII